MIFNLARHKIEAGQPIVMDKIISAIASVFKRKPDPRIAELERQLEQWKDNANRYRQERDDWNMQSLLNEGNYNNSIKVIQNLIQQL